ncbi:MAG: hypothetical protein K0Q43_4947 [Ramlibacter sp.]|jgi:hypothetical protein|nr:hypothetical protein [Ramlibacter sp.]
MQRKYLMILLGIGALAAVGVALFMRSDTEEQGTLAHTSHAEPLAVPPMEVKPSEFKNVFDQIQSLNLDPAVRKRLIVAYLESALSPRDQAFAYWESTAVREARDRLQRHQIDEEIRSQLRAAFGEEVAADPEFAHLFRPYSDRYPGLEPTKQLELQKLALMPFRALAESGVSPTQAQVKVRAAQREMQAQIARLLSAHELQEYQRKESPAARALAGGSFRFTQREFDAAFPVLARGGDDVVKRFDPQSAQGLREAMGDQRFLEYRKSHDPTFQMLSTIVASHGRQDANVDVAYDLVYKNQEATAEFLKAGPVLGFDAQKKKDLMTAELRSQLATNIGDEATEIFMRSMDANRGLVQPRMF